MQLNTIDGENFLRFHEAIRPKRLQDVQAVLYRRLSMVIVTFLLALLPELTWAAEIRQSNDIVVGPSQTVNDDLYAFGNTVTIQGTLRGDLVTFASSVNVPGTVTGDIIAAGGNVSIAGKVGGTVRVAGGTVIINGAVARDAVIAGGTLTLGPTARIGRDVLASGGSAIFDSPIGRNVLASVGDLTIGGTVAGNVNARVNSLRLTPSAVIDGNLVYTSDQTANISKGAVVRGSVERRAPEAEQPPPSPFTLIIASLIAWIRALVGLFALGVIFVLLFPTFARRSTATLSHAPWASLGLGFAGFVGVPALALVIFIIGLLIGGWWLSFALLALYGIALAVAFVVSGLFVGEWVLYRAGRLGVPMAWALLLGLIILTLIGFVPIFGGLVAFAAILMGLGALTLAAFREHQGTGVVSP